MYSINGEFIENFSNDDYITHANSQILENISPIQPFEYKPYSFEDCKNKCDNNNDCSLFMRINDKKIFTTSANVYTKDSCILLDTFDKFMDNNSIAKIGTIYTKPDHLFTTNQLKFIEYKDFDIKKNPELRQFNLDYANTKYPSTENETVQDVYNKINQTTKFKVTDYITNLNLFIYSLVGYGYSQMLIPNTIGLSCGTYCLRLKIKAYLPDDTISFNIIFGNTTVDLKKLNTNNKYITILILNKE